MNHDTKMPACNTCAWWLHRDHITQGAVILTEDRIIFFGSTGNKEASASDFITGTTICTSLCCCFPCCKGTSITRAYAPADSSPPQHPLQLDTDIPLISDLPAIKTNLHCLLRIAIEVR